MVKVSKHDRIGKRETINLLLLLSIHLFNIFKYYYSIIQIIIIEYEIW